MKNVLKYNFFSLYFVIKRPCNKTHYADVLLLRASHDQTISSLLGFATFFIILPHLFFEGRFKTWLLAATVRTQVGQKDDNVV